MFRDFLRKLVISIIMFFYGPIWIGLWAINIVITIIAINELHFSLFNCWLFITLAELVLVIVLTYYVSYRQKNRIHY